MYTATATSSASDKERLSTHIGGIAGKNDTSGIIEQCYIDNTRTGAITVKNGMVGGVTGYNKGTVALSGDKSTETLMANVREVSELLANAKDLSADSSWVKWEDGADIEELTYASSGSNRSRRDRTMQIIVIGQRQSRRHRGLQCAVRRARVAASAETGCSSTRSDSISVGTGGIIGMNESEKDLSFLLNRAFVGRQLRSSQHQPFRRRHHRHADQHAPRPTGLIEGCINYGTVYGCLSHYSGGIIGQWTNNGGTLERCYNYGNLQTTFKANWVGASGGIVAQLYHASSGQDFNILSCQNHGSLYGRNGTERRRLRERQRRHPRQCHGLRRRRRKGAGVHDQCRGLRQRHRASRSILAPWPPASSAFSRRTAWRISRSTAGAQQLITNATENITLNIDRCRNYAQTLSGYNFTAGIFGDRYALRPDATRDGYLYPELLFGHARPKGPRDRLYAQTAARIR